MTERRRWGRAVPAGRVARPTVLLKRYATTQDRRVYHGYNRRVSSLPVALSCVGVVKRYGSVIAVNGLDLQVLRGECFGLLGPNGAGKTTTIEILEGLLTADAGEVQVLGMRWDRDATQLRQRLGIQ